jgi:hypothetical protein
MFSVILLGLVSLFLLIVLLLRAIEPDFQRLSNRFRPHAEDLEGRLVPASWDWAPIGTSTDGTQAANWTQTGTEGADAVHGNPAAGDTLVFSDTFPNLQQNTFPANACVLPQPAAAGGPNVVRPLTAPPATGFALQVNGQYGNTITCLAAMTFTSVTVVPTASPTFDLGGNLCDFGSSTSLTGTIQNGTLSVTGSDVETWSTVTLKGWVNIQKGGQVTVTNSITYPAGSGNNGWKFSNDGTLTFGASTFFRSDSAAAKGVTTWFEPLYNTSNGTVLMQAGNVTIVSWIDNSGWVKIGSPTQSPTVTFGGSDPTSGASILGEKNSTTYMAAPTGATTLLQGTGVSAYILFVRTTASLLIDGTGVSKIAGNVGIVGTQQATAALTFLGPNSADSLSVDGTLTLDYSQTNVNVTFGTGAPTVNVITCTSLTRADTNTFVIGVNGTATTIGMPGIATIKSTNAPTGNDFQYHVLNDSGTWTEKWTGGTLYLTRQ